MPHSPPNRSHPHTPESVTRPDSLTLGAFAAAAVLAGGNPVAIRLGYAELPPFWGAAVRFLAAAAILAVAMAVMRLTIPRGRAFTGVMIYGMLSFGLSYMFAYWALTEVTAGTAMVVLAIVPLLTLVLAVVQGVERFHAQGLVGAVVAALGVALVFWDNIGAVSLGALVALFGGAVSMAEVNIVIKKFPRVHPVVENALGMAVGGGLLLLLSLVRAEPWVVPAELATQVSLAYLILLGSVGMFILYLIVLGRWTASAASYVLLIAPLVAVGLGAAILGERISWTFVVGGLLVLGGVYVGALHPRPPARAGMSRSGGAIKEP